MTRVVGKKVSRNAALLAIIMVVIFGGLLAATFFTRNAGFLYLCFPLLPLYALNAWRLRK